MKVRPNYGIDIHICKKNEIKISLSSFLLFGFFKVTLITSEIELREWIAEDQMPTTCGGPCSHDQLEWVEFQKVSQQNIE